MLFFYDITFIFFYFSLFDDNIHGAKAYFFSFLKRCRLYISRHVEAFGIDEGNSALFLGEEGRSFFTYLFSSIGHGKGGKLVVERVWICTSKFGI